MKNKFTIILVALFMAVLSLCSCSPSQKPEEKKTEDPPKVYSNEVQVVLLLGQSNAEGHTHSTYLTKTVGAEKVTEYATGYDNVKISYACTISSNTSNGQFTSVKLGQGYQTDRFGPEVGIAEKISALDPAKQVYIIKYAYGGTTLSSNWKSPSSKVTGGLYTGAVEYILAQCKKLEEQDLYPIIKAICWMQGESDASGVSYNSYEELERNFVADLRSDLAYYGPVDAQIGFIDAGISDCTAWTEYKVINNAKKHLAETGESHIYLDTIEANLRYNGEPAGAPDIYHYDSSSMIKLGNMFGDCLIQNFLEV